MLDFMCQLREGECLDPSGGGGGGGSTYFGPVLGDKQIVRASHWTTWHPNPAINELSLIQTKMENRHFRFKLISFFLASISPNKLWNKLTLALQDTHRRTSKWNRNVQTKTKPYTFGEFYGLLFWSTWWILYFIKVFPTYHFRYLSLSEPMR